MHDALSRQAAAFSNGVFLVYQPLGGGRLARGCQSFEPRTSMDQEMADSEEKLQLPPPSKYIVLAFWYLDKPIQDRYSFIRDTGVSVDNLPQDPDERKAKFQKLIQEKTPMQATWLQFKDGVEINGGLYPCLLLGWGGECFTFSC